MKRPLLIIFALLLLATTALLTWLLASESGLRWAYGQATAQLQGNLEITRLSGKLVGPITIQGFRYDNRGQIFAAGEIIADWNPWALLHANLEVTSLSVKTLDIVVPEPSNSGSSQQPPVLPELRLPFQVAIHNFGINAIRLTRGGRTYQLEQAKLDANLNADRLEIAYFEISSEILNLTLLGRVQPGKSFSHDIKLHWQSRLPSGAIVNGDGRIKGDLKATKLTQKLLGALQLDLALELRDPLEQLTWQAAIDNAIFDSKELDPGWPALRGTLGLTAAGDLVSAGASGQLKAESDAIGDFDATFKLRSLEGEDRFDGMHVELLRLGALDGGLSAEGQLRWAPALSWIAEISASTINPATLFPEWPGSVDATLSSSGNMENNELIATVDIRQLGGQLRKYPVSLQTSLQWRNQGVDITRFEFTSGDTRISSRGRIGDQLDLDWSLDSSDLAELYPTAQGNLSARGQLGGALAAPRIRASVTGNALGLPGYEIGRAKAEIALDLLRWQEFDINLEAHSLQFRDQFIQSLEVVADSGQIQANLVTDAGNAQIGLKGVIDTERWHGHIVQADIQTTSFANWKLKTPAAISLSSNSISSASICLQNGHASEICSAVNGHNDRWQLDLSADNLPLRWLKNWIPAQLEPDGLVNATAELEYRLPNQLLGQVEIDLPGAAVTYPLREGRPERFEYRSGRLALEMESTGISAKADLVLVGDDRFEGWFRLPGANLLALDPGTQTLQAGGKIKARELGMVDAIFDEVEELRGTVELDFTVSGSVSQPEILGSARVIDAGVSLPGFNLRLDHINVTAASETAERIAYRMEALTATGNLALRGNTILNQARGWPSSIQLEAQRFDISKILENWLPADVKFEGLLDSAANLKFRAPNNLLGQIDITAPKGSLSYPLLKGDIERWDYSNASLALVLKPDGVNVSAKSELGNNNHVDAQLTLPQARLLGLDTATQTLRGNARLDFKEMALIEALLPEIDQLRGELALNISVDGTLENPALSGEATVTDASLLIPRLGLSIDRINLSGATDDDKRFIFEATARSGDGGLTIRGSSRLEAAAGWPTSVHIEGENFEISRIPEAAVKISPELEIRLEHQSIDVRGELHVPYARLQPRDTTTAARVSQDAVIIGAETVPASKWSITSGVNLTLGERVNFFGFGFESQLSGKLLIEEEPGQVTRGSGEINILKGRYRAYGQFLDIEKGRLLFTGVPLTNPGLDIRAIRKSNGITTGIKVRGRLQQPQLELFSIPAMGQTDTLSYLLLGRPMENATGAEGAMMAKAALALGLAGGDQLAKIIGDRFGLDEMRVESSESGDQASLVVGRYLSPRLYVSYGVGLIESFNTLNLRYQISDKWQLKTESGETQGADLLYTLER